MNLTPEDIEEFRQIYKKEYKEEISIDEARTMAHSLIELCALLTRPLPGDLKTEASKGRPSSIPVSSPPQVVDIVPKKKPGT